MGFVQCGQESLQMRTSALFEEKNLEIFEIYEVSARTRGLSQFGHFANKGGRDQFFAILCGRPLWTAPYLFSIPLIVMKQVTCIE